MEARKIKYLCIAFFLSLSAYAQESVSLDLSKAIDMATANSLDMAQYVNDYRMATWQYRIYEAGRLPSVSFNLAPQYYRYITKRYDSNDNTDVYREQQTFNFSTGLGATQTFEPLGGTFYLNTSLDYLRNLGESNYTQYSTVPFKLGYRQDLLGYNALKWEKRIEPLKLEKAKKMLVYNREQVAERVTGYFFDLAMAQADYELALDNCSNADSLYIIGERKQKIASISQADLLTLKLDKINAHNSLRNAETLRRNAMKVLADYIGMDKMDSIYVVIPSSHADILVDMQEAVARMYQNNPSVLANRQTELEAEQTLDKIKKESAFSASVDASVGFNQVANQFSAAYRHPLQQDLVSVSLSIPLLDWGVRKGNKRVAQLSLDNSKVARRQNEQELEEELLSVIGDFHIQLDLIASAEEAVRLADLAYQQNKQRFIIGKVDVNSVTLALNRQQEARKNYISALQNYWQDYYKIRRMTLFDFQRKVNLTDEFNFEKCNSR